MGGRNYKRTGKPRGGARRGSGRKKGAIGKARQQAQAAAKRAGVTPLDYMLAVMNRPGKDPKTLARRDAMAVAAAPYVHPKLAAIEHSGNIGNKTHEEALDELEDDADGK